MIKSWAVIPTAPLPHINKEATPLLLVQLLRCKTVVERVWDSNQCHDVYSAVMCVCAEASVSRKKTSLNLGVGVNSWVEIWEQSKDGTPINFF